MFFEIGRELGVEVVPQQRAVGGKEVEHLVPVAEPPLAGERVEGEAVGAEEFERGVVDHRLARGQGDGEVMLGAVHGERREVVVLADLGLGLGPRLGGGSGRGRNRLGQVFCHARQVETVPGQGKGGAVGAVEDTLAGERADEFAELGALQLDERHGLRGHAEALEDGQGRHQALR